ncbi:MAG TPA: DUF2163 domain-containing protein, partial [Rhizomicrobium sp.]|nr:DUF2163 domain-containing protein [Rhizomicrobium sp.]
DHLESGVTTLCWCWTLTRRDGVVQGFTDHDEPVVLSGTAHEAVSGFTASEVQSSLGLAVDNLTVNGALSSASLNEADLAAGLYDDAGVEIWRVNWSAPEQRVLMRKGSIGEVTRSGAGFKAELRGLAHRLNQPVGRAYGYSCDADLGDARCGKDLTAFAAKTTVASVTDSRRFALAALGDGFTGGLITFTSGANAGRAMEIKRQSGTAIELWQAMSEPVSPGDGVTLIAGCDKQFATCKTKFANGINFRGFPYMPGNDAVMSGPSTTTRMDGGSRYGN